MKRFGMVGAQVPVEIRAALVRLASERSLADFQDQLTKLTDSLQTATDKMTDAEFEKEFRTKLEDAERDLERFSDRGVQAPDVVTNAFARLNRIDLVSWARKEAQGLASITDSIRELDQATAEAAADIDRRVNEAIGEQLKIRQDAAKTAAEIEERRLQHLIEMAKQTGQVYRQIYTGPKNAPGMLQPGNIDLANRPRAKNPLGGTSTVFSMSFEEDNREVLIPRVNLLGQIMSAEEAIAEFHRTHQHLGMFDTAENATAYAQALHQQQEALLRTHTKSADSWKQLYALERRLREVQLNEAKRSLNAEYDERAANIDRTTQAGIDEYELLRAQQKQAIDAMDEDFALGEQEKLDELRKTNLIWLRTWEEMKTVAKDSIFAISDGFASILVGARSFKDAMLDIWRAIQRGIQSILADVLN